MSEVPLYYSSVAALTIVCGEWALPNQGHRDPCCSNITSRR